MAITLIQFLRQKGKSNSQAKKLLKSGKVRHYGVPTLDPGRLIEPENISILQNSPRMVVGRDPVILYKDPGFVVTWKPANYLSVPARNRRKEYSVISFVHRIFGQALAVHRLDEGTSGLMLVAINEQTQKKLKDALEVREIHRHYLAIVRGKMDEEHSIRNTLVRNRGDGLRGSGADGKLAVTHLRPLENLYRSTLVEATLDTGRTHQIRIHLSEAGHPVLGDNLYGASYIQNLAPRLALHAWKLSFLHPKTAVKMEFIAPLADDLEQKRRELQRRLKR